MADIMKLEAKQDLTISQIGKIFASSGFFQDTKSEAQAITKILAGRENGFDPFTSMSQIHIIKGKMEMGAALVGNAIKRSGKYDYKVRKLTNDACEIEFFERSALTGGKFESVGISSFTQDDAKQAGLSGDGTNYKKYPRNMLFSRAMTNGQFFFAPDVFQSRIYGEGEISQAVQQNEPSNEPPKDVTPQDVNPDDHTWGRHGDELLRECDEIAALPYLANVPLGKKTVPEYWKAKRDDPTLDLVKAIETLRKLRDKHAPKTEESEPAPEDLSNADKLDFIRSYYAPHGGDNNANYTSAATALQSGDLKTFDVYYQQACDLQKKDEEVSA